MAKTNKNPDILQAAYELFVENGFDNTSMKMIAQKANTPQSHIYNFYASKEILFGAVLRMAQDSYQNKMFTAVQQYADLPVEEFIERCADVVLEFRQEACLVISSTSIAKLRYIAEPILKEYSDGMIKMMEPLFSGYPDDVLYNIGSLLLAVTDSLLIDGDRERGIRTGIFAMKLFLNIK